MDARSAMHRHFSAVIPDVDAPRSTFPDCCM
jgi:hypothetical protein